MNLITALQADRTMQMAVVGAGGKTTIMTRLAREFEPPVILTTSTHLSVNQSRLADYHYLLQPTDEINDTNIPLKGVTLFTGPEVEGGKLTSPTTLQLEMLHNLSEQNHIPLIIEADGSRGLPLKAPASHEPPIPLWVNTVAVVSGMMAFDCPFSAQIVHRAELFRNIVGIEFGEKITTAHIFREMGHPLGGLKNIPNGAKKVAILNQSDSSQLQATAGQLAKMLLPVYQTILITSLIAETQREVAAAYQNVAGVILAAGGSSRYGKVKILLNWKGVPFIYQVAATAIAAGLSPVVVVVGDEFEEISRILKGLPVVVVHNDAWKEGQSTSIKAGINKLPETVGGAIFMLADQPQISINLISALISAFWISNSPIVAPMIDGRRGNPVLFNRSTFGEMLKIQGDVGGRAVFSKYPIQWVEWADESMLLDVDTPGDYDRLVEKFRSEN